MLAAAWSLGVLAVAGVSLSLYFNHVDTERFDDGLSDSLDGLIAGISVEDGVVSAPPVTDPGAVRVYSGEYWQIAVPAASGGLRAVVRSRSLWDRTLPPPPGGARALAAAPGKTLFYDSPGPLHQPLRIGAVQARLPDLATPVVLMAAQDRTPVNRDVRTFITTIGAALGLLGAGLIVAVIVQVRVGLQPLFALRREVAAVRTGEAERVAGTYPIELEPLATELNALVAHNQGVVERQRTHVGNLAHALKTPLSVMLTEAEQRPGPLAEVVTRQAQSMSQQVDHHLRRARAAARTQGLGERTDVAAVVEELARTLERIYRDKLSAVDFECAEGLWFLGERQDLLEIAGNVMENACKWSFSQVRVTTAALAGLPRRWRLTVEDDGPGLADDQRAEVLRRGARLDETAPGSGLGLSIVDELTRAYGGTITLSRASLGGLRLELVLPAADV